MEEYVVLTVLILGSQNTHGKLLLRQIMKPYFEVSEITFTNVWTSLRCNDP